MIFKVLVTTLFLSLALFAQTTPALAATLNLNPGETASIHPNVTTSVVCGMGPVVPNCQRAIESFENRYNICTNSYPESTCFQNEWDTFKTRERSCITEAFDKCNELCTRSYPTSTCYNNCR